jgi:hypothetical protein
MIATTQHWIYAGQWVLEKEVTARFVVLSKRY